MRPRPPPLHPPVVQQSARTLRRRRRPTTRGLLGLCCCCCTAAGAGLLSSTAAAQPAEPAAPQVPVQLKAEGDTTSSTDAVHPEIVVRRERETLDALHVDLTPVLLAGQPTFPAATLATVSGAHMRDDMQLDAHDCRLWEQSDFGWRVPGCSPLPRTEAGAAAAQNDTSLHEQLQAKGIRRILIVYRVEGVFGQTAVGLQSALSRLGLESEVQQVEDDAELSDPRWQEEEEDPSTLVIVICHQFFARLPRQYVLLQMEQVTALKYVQTHLAGALAVWDFSPMGLSFLREDLRVGRASFLPVYTPPPYNRIRPPPGQYVAVLFNGWLSKRRVDMLQPLLDLGIPIYWEPAWGDALESLVQQSLVVLNLHQLDDAALEVHRLNPLLLQGKCIVSEASSDPILDAVYSSGIIIVHTLQEIFDTLRDLLGDQRERQRWQWNALVLGRRLQADMVPLRRGMEVALDALDAPPPS